MALFQLDDKSVPREVSADEAVWLRHQDALRDDQLVVLSVLAQQDRFSGGLRLKVQQVWDLPAARCRFGKFLRVVLGDGAPALAPLLAEFPPRVEMTEQGELERSLPIRLALERRDAQGRGVAAELQLGDRARIFPSDDALQRWVAQAEDGRAAVVYE